MTDSPAIVSRLRAAGCVFAEDEAALLTGAAGSPGELEAMVAARVRGLPLEQVIGWAEFRGLRILVAPGVFVPRRRSEFLVQTAISLVQPGNPSGSRVISGAMAPFMTHDHDGQPEAPSTGSDIPGISPPCRPIVVDLCCGTGALGLATAAALPSAELHSADLDPAAVACARRNVEPAGGRVYQGDLFAPLPASLRGGVAILICNAPYVPTGEIAFMPVEARDHEAPMALDGGGDGLAVLRRAAAQAPGWLAPGGTLLVETSQRQAGPMAEAMASAGLSARVHHDDEMGATVITGIAPAARAANSWRRA